MGGPTRVEPRARSSPEEVELIRATARRFMRERLQPLEEEVERDDDVAHDVLAHLREEAAALGLYGFNLPASLGGPGLDVDARLAILEEITRTSVALSEVVGHLPLSLLACSQEQRDRILPAIVDGRDTITYALTEPDAGSDLASIRTRAVRTEDGWTLTGSKQFISNAESAAWIIVLAVSAPEAPVKQRLTTFLVRGDDPGIRGMTRFRKMGWRGYHLNGFTLEECFVPECDVLGDVGDGFSVMLESINHDRIFSACRSVGIAQRAQEMACAYAQERRAFGVRLADHQAIQFMVADNDVEIEAARGLIHRAAERLDAGAADARIASSRAKLYASEMGCRVADRALQIFGGMGYMAELPMERFYRDARAFRIGEGTSEMQRLQIARHRLSQ